MTTEMKPEFFEEAIRRAIEERISEIIKEETTATVERVESRIQEQIGTIALSVFSEYEVSRRADRIIIQVKNRKPTNIHRYK